MPGIIANQEIISRLIIFNKEPTAIQVKPYLNILIPL